MNHCCTCPQGLLNNNKQVFDILFTKSSGESIDVEIPDEFESIISNIKN